MSIEELHEQYVKQNEEPPAQWMMNLDGEDILVNILYPLPFGKWRCLELDGEDLVVDAKDLDPREWRWE
jgi:hypothetical protein